MKILYLTDIHYDDDIKNLNFTIDKIIKNIDITTLDIILIGGDITNFGNYREAEIVINTLKRINDNVLSIPGNCDNKGVVEYLKEYKINLDDTVYEYNNYLIMGIGGSLITPFNTPNEYNEEQFNDKIHNVLHALSKYKYHHNDIILVTHQPPFEIINDKIYSGIHIGSNTINELIKNIKPVVCLTGHVHEGLGVDMIYDVKVVNPGTVMNKCFAVIDINNNMININMF